jgi:hypothetical protein
MNGNWNLEFGQQFTQRLEDEKLHQAFDHGLLGP